MLNRSLSSIPVLSSLTHSPEATQESTDGFLAMKFICLILLPQI